MVKAGDFFKWYLHIDWKDITNYIALIFAILLFWWGIKTIIASLSYAAP
ncbi:MAG: hypothetical protein KKD17_04815 [Nanoarchaeota archaeon]|nr:hypothetical protein [Nanoarchaeota archaeon]